MRPLKTPARRPLVLSVVVALVSFSLIGIATSTPSDASTANYLHNSELNGQAADLAATLAPHVKSLTGYAYMQVQSQGLVVATTRSARSSLVRQAIRSARENGPALPVTYKIVQRSAMQLDSIDAQLLNERSTWAKKGVLLEAWGPNDTSNTVVIHLKHYTTQAAALLAQRYHNAVTVAKDQHRTGPSDTTPTRQADTPTYGYSGGLTITTSSTTCSGWFNTWNTKTFIAQRTTAGHCGAGTWSSGAGYLYGTVTSSHVVFHGPSDAEIANPIDNTLTNEVWADPNWYGRPVSKVYTAFPASNVQVCTDGQTDGENCKVTIRGLGQTDCYDTECISGLASASTGDGSDAFSPGDSGGPVYTVPAVLRSNDAVTAVGMIVAYYGPSSDPYTGGYIESVGNVYAATGNQTAIYCGQCK